MAKPQSTAKQTTAAQKDTGDQPLCGVIMPISATASHTERHWQDVQQLLHRAITNTGFSPKNVWDSSTTDRISERIIGNIFTLPIVVVDISDLNPNVMFELGLRLSSKRPTIVIAEKESAIPFDIRDFQILFYPRDMNMLGMEAFFKEFSQLLRKKHEHYEGENYSPFLANVIVDVASPETREVGLNELILSRLDDIGRRVSSIEARVPIRPRPSTSNPFAANKLVDLPPPGKLEFIVPEEKFEEFEVRALSLSGVHGVFTSFASDGKVEGEVIYSGGKNRSQVIQKIIDTIEEFGGEDKIPF